MMTKSEIDDLIRAIRKRPGMYFKRPSEAVAVLGMLLEVRNCTKGEDPIKPKNKGYHRVLDDALRKAFDPTGSVPKSVEFCSTLDDDFAQKYNWFGEVICPELDKYWK